MVGLTNLFLGVYVGGETGYGNFVLVYAKWNLAMPEAHGQYLSSLFWCFISIGRLIAIPLAKIMTNKNMLIMEMSISLASALVLLCFSSNPTILWIFTCVFGLGMSAIWPTVMALI